MSYSILNITIKEVDLTRTFMCDGKDRITLSDQLMGNSSGKLRIVSTHIKICED